jgi:membrane fusion protein (multidrug efflux system)
VAGTDDAFVGGDVIPVLSRVSGYVDTVTVRENDRVRAGQPLVTIDARELRQRLAQAEADLAVARDDAGHVGAPGGAQARARAAQATAASARAGISAAEANAQKAQADLKRMASMLERQMVSQQQYDDAATAARAAEAQLQMARQDARADEAQAAAAQSDVGGARGHELAAAAAVEQARLQLEFTRIAAPTAGVVARKNVQVGQYVNAGEMLMAVVPIDSVWIVANLKETQLKDLDSGDPARITLDAYPGLVFRGRGCLAATGATFSLLPPENATGNFTKVVQRVPVRIRLAGDNPQIELRPGMSCLVKIQKKP